MLAKLAKLNSAQLYEVEKMASTGMPLSDIGLCLGFPVDEFRKMQAADGRIVEAFNIGRNEGIRTVSDVLLKSTAEGDISAARLLLKRIEKEEEIEGPAISEAAMERVAEAGRRAAASAARQMEDQRRLLADVLYEPLSKGGAYEMAWLNCQVGEVTDDRGRHVRYCGYTRTAR